MTLLFDRHRSITSPGLVPAEFDHHNRRAGQIELSIGLVNNMPDSALKATEKQFARLLRNAAPANVRLRFHCFALPSIARSKAAQSHVAQTYRDIGELQQMGIDGLIVTGAEPIADDLRNEPYWPDLAALIDWARTGTRSTIWSCLAAHAAVLHLDGVQRRRLDAKCSGIYDCRTLGGDSWLTADAGDRLKVPHSRWNGLDRDDLVSRDYDVLTGSDSIGVDVFTKRLPSQFVFFQGHPEYDALSLQREYMRDIARFLNGAREDYPNIPACYFDAQTEDVLNDFAARARRLRDPMLAAELPGLTLRPDLEDGVAATRLFGSWISYLASGSARNHASSIR